LTSAEWKADRRPDKNLESNGISIDGFLFITTNTEIDPIRIRRSLDISVKAINLAGSLKAYLDRTERSFISGESTSLGRRL
jgi:hypothetical protein